MERPIRGDIVVIPFPFSDLTATKKRPALVLATLDFEDVILCQITSKIKLDSRSLEIRTMDFATGQLPSTSYIRCGKLFTANSSIIERIAGSLTHEALDRFAERNAAIIMDK